MRERGWRGDGEERERRGRGEGEGRERGGRGEGEGRERGGDITWLFIRAGQAWALCTFLCKCSYYVVKIII